MRVWTNFIRMRDIGQKTKKTRGLPVPGKKRGEKNVGIPAERSAR